MGKQKVRDDVLHQSKNNYTKLHQAQQLFDIARSRDIPTKDILCCKLTDDSILSDEIYLMDPDKSISVSLLEKSLHHSNYIFKKQNSNSRTLVADFMTTIRKISPSDTSNIKSMLNAAWNLIKSTTDANHIHTVYNSYLAESIMECERIHRGANADPLEF